eukprot:1690533-Alexandrium_andersonii.AAC.1
MNDPGPSKVRDKHEVPPSAHGRASAMSMASDQGSRAIIKVGHRRNVPQLAGSVSYTHLTLPTICSV